MHGILPIYKKKDVFSTEIGRNLKRLLGKSTKIGHLGTLDPLAEGILPMLLGEANKFHDDLQNLSKRYFFDVEFGYETDSLDLEGQTVKTNDLPAPSLPEIEAILPAFMGQQFQVAPIFSAIKVNGKRLCDMARKGIEIQPPPKREITIYDLKCEGITEKTASFSVHCSKGTYVRSLARDIAYQLNTMGTVTRLIRTESCNFGVAESVDIESLANIADIEKYIIPVNTFTKSFDSIDLRDPADVQKITFGQTLKFNSTQIEDSSRFVLNSVASLEEIHDNKMWLLRSNLGEILGKGSLILSPCKNFLYLKLTRGLKTYGKPT